MNNSRRYQEIKKQIPNNKYYNLSEALEFLRNNNKEKIKTIKVSFSLNWVNQKNILKTKLTLPYLVKKEKKIAIVKEGLPEDILKSCQEIKKVKLLELSEIRQATTKKKPQWGFEKIIVHSASEDLIKPLQKILGPKGIYPSKKNGSVTENVLEEIKKFQQGEMDLKTDKGGNIHIVIGSNEFNSQQLKENYTLIYNKVLELKTIGWKGDFVKNITLSTAMGPGLRILK
ncbi:MAG: 50S ribosomal protein L1 [Mycoplasmataceae bacterium]|nr:MAG: 50S ribosomal protein L1 [Mycoplasmataceae bacterium]